MKRIISVFLAVLMVFSTTVMAAPKPAETVGTVEETTQTETGLDGDLQSLVDVKPGINMLTGTSSPLTASTNGVQSILNGFQIPDGTTLTTCADPTGTKDHNVIAFNLSGNDARQNNYPTIQFKYTEQDNNLKTLVGHNKIHFKFDYKKYVANLTEAVSAGNYVEKENFWIMNNDGSATSVCKGVGVTAANPWKSYDGLIDMVQDQTKHDNSWNFRFQLEVVKSDKVDSQFLLDNFYAVPAYEFKFYSKDGTKLLGTRYAAFGSDGNIITSYAPEAGLYGNYYVSSWSTTAGGDAVTSVSLNNQNVSFYACDMADAFTFETNGKFVNANDVVKYVPKVISVLKDSVVVKQGNWSVDETDVISIKQNEDGSVDVKALKSGTATMHYKYADGVTDVTVKVVLPYRFANPANAKGNFVTSTAIDPVDYTALIVKLNNTTVDETYTFTYKIGDGAEKTTTVKATTTGAREYYVDLTALDGWTTGENVSLKFTGNGNFTVEDIRLYEEFDSGFSLKLSSDSDYLSSVGEETVVTGEFVSALEGVYDEDFDLEVIDEDDVAFTKINDDGTVTVHAGSAKGIVTVKATSKEDSSVTATKDIYVNVDTSKYGFYREFIETTNLSDAKFEEINGASGTTSVSIVDGKLHMVHKGATSGGGGLSSKGMSVPATQKYLVVKATSTSKFHRLYYRWDSVSHSETNTASSPYKKITLDDGTALYIFNMANVPSDAQYIKDFMLQISVSTTADIISIYTTSELPTEAPSRKIGIMWDFNDSTNLGFSKPAQFQGYSSGFGDGYVKLVANSATINGTSMRVEVTQDTANNRYVISKQNSGSMNSNTPMSSKGVSFDDYNYLVIKAKGNKQFDGKFGVYINDKDGALANAWSVVSFILPLTTEYKVYAINVRSLLGKDFGENYNNMMFQFGTNSTLDSSAFTADETVENKWYSATAPTYTDLMEAYIDEMYIANYDPTVSVDTPLNMAVTLEATSNSITTDGGSVVVTPHVYANKAVSTTDVTYSVTKGAARIKKNDDGTLTVTGVSNGEVEITAVAVEDSKFKGTITINVSGQRNKVSAYDFKYYAIGNSYLIHGYNKNFNIWLKEGEPARGMAASSADKDYFNRVQYYIGENFTGSISAERIGAADLERSTENATTVETATAAIEANSAYKSIKNYLINNQPNIITVQLAENFKGTGVIEQTFYDVVYKMISQYRPENSVVVVITPFSKGTRTNVIKQYAEKYGFYVADMSYISDYNKVPATTDSNYNSSVEAVSPVTGETKLYYRGNSDWKYNPYLAWAQYPQYDDLMGDGRADFRSHPGDKGMDEIGKKVYDQLKVGVPSFLTASFVYYPESLTINGGDAITTLDGTLNLTATASPSDASNKVIWSVDNETYATISADGKLTAKNNGSVVVKATSAYDSSVFVTKTITISGQAQAYTVTYNAGTDDTVTGLPASDSFAKGEYTLSSSVPERNGYKFLGWATSVNGTPVKTVTVNANTTVYATWTLAESWHFDEDNNKEGISLGGFNVTVASGVATVLSYGDGVAVSNTKLLLDSDVFDKFNVRINVSETTETNPILALKVISTAGEYTYSQNITNAGQLVTYSFDISDVEGKITGFILSPSPKECQAIIDWIEFERVALDSDVKLDKVNVVSDYTVNMNGNTYSIDSLTVETGKTVKFTDGTVVVNSISGNGTVVCNGSLVYTGTETLDGYNSVDVGAKTAEGNVRYAEVDGEQYLFDGDTYGYILADGVTKLVQIVEKTDANAVVTVSSKYYLVTNDSATELNILENAVDNVDEISLRTEEPAGLRFKARITNTAKANTVVTEYGFVIALEREVVKSGKQLNLDFNKKVTGSAYIDGSKDIIYDADTDYVYFTGVLYNIPKTSYNVKLMTKVFTKLSIDGEEYVVYGEPVVASPYQIAKALSTRDDLSEAQKEFVNSIIDEVDGDNEAKVDYGDL